MIKKYWPIILIFLLSLIPLLWFKNNLILAGGDESILINPGAMLKSTFYAWNPVYNGGNPTGDYQGSVAHLFPFVLFWATLAKLGLSLVVIEKLWFISVWFISGLGIYFLVKTVFGKKENWQIFAIVAATMYLVNLFIMQYPLMYTVRLPIMVAPWMLAFMIAGLRENKIRFSIYFGLISLLSAPGWVNPPAAIIMLTIPSLYFIFYLIYYKKIASSIIFFTQSLFFFLLFNLYWIYPFLNNLLQSSADIKENATNLFFGTSSIFDILRLMGSWAFRALGNKLPYFYFNDIYYSNLYFSIGSFFFIIITLLGFLNLSFVKKNKKIIFFFLLAVLGMFLAKGSHPPLGNIFNLLHKYMPGFWIFREPYTKFMPIALLGLSMTTGFAAVSIVDWISKKNYIYNNTFLKFAITLFFVSIIIMVSWPLVTGKSIYSQYDGPAKPYYAQIPTYWYDLANYLKTNNPDATLLILPKNNPNSTTYDWTNGFTLKGSVATYIISNPYFYYQHYPLYTNEKMIQMIYDQIVNDKNDDYFGKKLGFFGINYILVEHDQDPRFAKKDDIYNSDKIDSMLKNKLNLNKIKTFGKLDLWQVDTSKIFPKVSLGKNPLYLEASDVQKQIIPLMESIYINNKNNNIIINNPTSPDTYPEDSTLAQTYSITDPNVKITDNLININFDITKAGSYDFHYKSASQESEKLSLNDHVLESKFLGEQNSDSEYLWSKINLGALEKGRYDLSFVNSIENVGINDNSFENISYLSLNQTNDYNWEFVDVSLNSPQTFYVNANTTNDAIDGQKSIKISSFGHSVGLRQKIKLEKGKNYLLSFYYKNYDDIQTSYTAEFVYKNDEGRLVPSASFNQKLPINKNWTQYSTTFKADTEEMYLYFYSHGNLTGSSVALDNVNIKKINIDPNSFIFIQNSYLPTGIKNADFQKINPSSYITQINATDTFYLNFLESYNKDWKIYAFETNEPVNILSIFFKKPLVSEKNHYSLDGFGNSWRITKTGQYKILILYTQQLYSYLFYAVSALSITIGLFIVFRSKKIKPIK